MKKNVILLAAAVVMLAPGVASANFLNNAGFENFTGTFSSADGVAGSNAATWGNWISGPPWRSVAGPSGAPAGWSGSNFAQQSPAYNPPGADQVNTRDILMQGFAGSQVAAGSGLELSFNYLVANTGYPTQVIVYGINAGQTWSRFGPWACTGCTQLYSANLANTASWQSSTHNFQVTGNFAAIAVGFIFGANLDTFPNYISGLDNVRLVVPEPMTLALFGAGLLGVGLARRRRHHA